MEYRKVLTSRQVKILQHDLADIKDWIDRAIEGKINNCLKRIALEERERLVVVGVKLIPATTEDLVNSAFNNPAYKSRAEREK